MCVSLGYLCMHNLYFITEARASVWVSSGVAFVARFPSNLRFFFNEIIACISIISLRGSAPHQLTREQERQKRCLKSPQKTSEQTAQLYYNLVNLDLILINR